MWKLERRFGIADATVLFGVTYVLTAYFAKSTRYLSEISALAALTYVILHYISHSSDSRKSRVRLTGFVPIQAPHPKNKPDDQTSSKPKFQKPEAPVETEEQRLKNRETLTDSETKIIEIPQAIPVIEKLSLTEDIPFAEVISSDAGIPKDPEILTASLTRVSDDEVTA